MIGRLELARTSTNNTGWQFYTVTLWAAEQLLTCLLWLSAYLLASSSLFPCIQRRKRRRNSREGKWLLISNSCFSASSPNFVRFSPPLALPLLRPLSSPLFPRAGDERGGEGRISQSAHSPRRCARPIRAKMVAHAVRYEARASRVLRRGKRVSQAN